MKTLRNFALSAMLAVGALGTSTLTSCNGDKCDDITCQNGATCSDGDCVCATGYEGGLCETESRAKFARIAAWNASDNSAGGTPVTYTCLISNGNGILNVVIDNDFADGFFLNNVNATVSQDGKTITIPSQEPDNDDYFVSGTGTYSNGQITWSYVITPPLPDSPVSFTGLWK